MSGDGTRKAYTLSWGTKLELGIKKSDLVMTLAIARSKHVAAFLVWMTIPP